MRYYHLKFLPEAEKQYNKLDNSIRKKCNKKLQKLKKANKKRRHLRFGEKYFVEEVGQYRIIYEINEDEVLILVVFIDKHKKYESFLGVREVVEEYFGVGV